jgi:soluble lytic murein transglycosylase-like protein
MLIWKASVKPMFKLFGMLTFLGLACVSNPALATVEQIPVPSVDMNAMKQHSAKPKKVTTAYASAPILFPAVASPSELFSLTQFIGSYNRKLSAPQAQLMAEAIMGISQNWGVDFRLLTAIVAVESSFRTDVISSSGAIGLGQLKPATASWLGVSNPFDPLENLAGTSKYLRFLLDKYPNNLDAAVAAYYQGQGFVDRNGITAVCRQYLVKVNNVITRMPM